MRAAAEHRIEQALGHAVGGVPADPAPQIEAVEGDTGEVLVAASATAQLLVVGSHRTSGVAAAVLGSVSHHCALHAHCPVVIIPAGVEISPDGQLGSAGAPEVASEGRGVK